MFNICTSMQMQFSKESNLFMNSLIFSNNVNNEILNVIYVINFHAYLRKGLLWFRDMLEVISSNNDHLKDSYWTKFIIRFFFSFENQDNNCICKNIQFIKSYLCSDFLIFFPNRMETLMLLKWLGQHKELVSGLGNMKHL